MRWTTQYCCIHRARAAEPRALCAGTAAMLCHWAAAFSQLPRCPSDGSSMRTYASLHSQPRSVSTSNLGRSPSGAQMVLKTTVQCHLPAGVCATRPHRPQQQAAPCTSDHPLTSLQLDCLCPGLKGNFNYACEEFCLLMKVVCQIAQC